MQWWKKGIGLMWLLMGQWEMGCAKQVRLLVCLGRWKEEDVSLIELCIVLSLTVYAWMGY